MQNKEQEKHDQHFESNKRVALNYSNIVNESDVLRASFRQALGWCPLMVKLLILSLVIPTVISISIGPLRLTPYRVVLIVGFIVALMKPSSGKAEKLSIVDFLLIFHVIWSFIVIAWHHGIGIATESGGIRLLEVYGAYLIAKVYVVDARSYRGATTFLILIVCILAPLALIESMTGLNIIKLISSALMGQGIHFNSPSSISMRFGLSRASGPFDHPILFGIFSASIFGMAWFEPCFRTSKRYSGRRVFAIVLAASTSLSSGAIAALMTQVTICVWEKLTRAVKGRWRIFTVIILIMYFSVDLLSNRSGIKVFLSYLTFSAHTAYNRIIIFNFGIQDVWRNPLFGIGFNVWSKPSWMHSDSMDNFWLVQGVTFGLPGFLSIALATYFLLRRKWKNLPHDVVLLRIGYTVSMIGIVIATCTVHLWNNSLVLFSFMLGLGVWFGSQKQRSRVFS